MKSIGDRIREIREKKGWTQDDLANAADMNRIYNDEFTCYEPPRTARFLS